MREEGTVDVREDWFSERSIRPCPRYGEIDIVGVSEEGTVGVSEVGTIVVREVDIAA